MKCPLCETNLNYSVEGAWKGYIFYRGVSILKAMNEADAKGYTPGAIIQPTYTCLKCGYTKDSPKKSY
jgi:hypothetical protein